MGKNANTQHFHASVKKTDEESKKSWGWTIFKLPGILIRGIGQALFGTEEEVVCTSKLPIMISLHENGWGYLQKHGLLGTLWAGVQALFIDAPRAVFDFVAEHKEAVAAAFWASLVVGGIVALVLAFGPASLLAAVVTFTVLGLSLASFAATTAVQLVLVTSLAVALTSLVVFSGAAIGNFCLWAIGKDQPTPNEELKSLLESSSDEDNNFEDPLHAREKSTAPRNHSSLFSTASDKPASAKPSFSTADSSVSAVDTGVSADSPLKVEEEEESAASCARMTLSSSSGEE